MMTGWILIFTFFFADIIKFSIASYILDVDDMNRLLYSNSPYSRRVAASISPKSYTPQSKSQRNALSAGFLNQVNGFGIRNHQNGYCFELVDLKTLEDNAPFKQPTQPLDATGELQIFLASLNCPSHLMTNLSEAVNLSKALNNGVSIFECPDIFGTILKAMIRSLIDNQHRGYLSLLHLFNLKAIQFSQGLKSHHVPELAVLLVSALFKDEISVNTFNSVILSSMKFLSDLTGIGNENGNQMFLSCAIPAAAASIPADEKLDVLMKHFIRNISIGAMRIPTGPISETVKVSFFALYFEFVCKQKSTDLTISTFLYAYSSYFDNMIFSNDDTLLILTSALETNNELVFQTLLNKPCTDLSLLLSSPFDNLVKIKSGLIGYLPSISELNLNPETFEVFPGAEPLLLEIFCNKATNEEVFCQMMLKKLYQPLDALVDITGIEKLKLQSMASLMQSSANIKYYKDWILNSVYYERLHYISFKLMRIIEPNMHNMNNFILSILETLPEELFTCDAIGTIISYASHAKDLFKLALNSKSIPVLEMICAMFRIEKGSWTLLEDDIAGERGVMFYSIGDHQMMQIIDEYGQSFDLPVII